MDGLLSDWQMQILLWVTCEGIFIFFQMKYISKLAQGFF